MGVSEELIRSLEGSGGGHSSGSRLEEGMKVEARYRGKSRYYPGKIRRVDRDGTFDIDYDDGEREMGVAEELIRSLEGSGGGHSSGSRLEEGMKVEARYRGKS